MIQKLFESFKKDTKIVAYARFNQSKRLSRKSWWSLFSISAISFSLILISIGEKFFQLEEISPLLFFKVAMPSWVFSVFCSIAILALSIAISSSKVEVKYEKITTSAIKINKISRELELELELGGTDVDRYKSLLCEYNSSLMSDQTNHDDIDYTIARLSLNKKNFFQYYYNFYIKQYVEIFPYFLITFISLGAIFSVLEKIIL